jgi:hypothetical protein
MGLLFPFSLDLLEIVVVHLPTEIAGGCLVYGTSHLREIRSYMVFEALLADESQ